MALICCKGVNEFFEAVKEVFSDEWDGMNAKTSRLRHGAGLVAMGFVMELLHSSEGATTRDEFEPGLRLLKEHTAWTTGQWHLADNDVRPWNGIQKRTVEQFGVEQWNQFVSELARLQSVIESNQS